MASGLLISQNMLRRQEMDFLDDITLEEAVRELGVPIYPIEQDGFALWDAMAGVLPEVKLPERGEESQIITDTIRIDKIDI